MSITLAHRTVSLLALAVGAFGCAQSLPGDEPAPGIALYYPTAMVASLDQSTVFVVSSNFDQQFSSGWITSVDVAQIVGNPNNAHAALTRQVAIPSLGASIALSANGEQAAVPVRGQGTLTMLDIKGSQVTCGVPGAGSAALPSQLERTDCDRAHLIDLIEESRGTFLENDAAYTFSYRDFQDPYAVASLSGSRLNNVNTWVVGYVSSGWLSTLVTGSDGATAVTHNFTLTTGTVSSLTPHSNGYVLATTRLVPTSSDRSRIYDIDVVSSVAAIQPGTSYAAQDNPTDVYGNAGGMNMSGLVLSPDLDRLYALNQYPDALVVLDHTPLGGATQISAAGAVPTGYEIPMWQVLSATPLGQTLPSAIAYIPRASGDLLVVASLLQDTLYFFRPQGSTAALMQRLTLSAGQGPFALQQVSFAGGDYLFVTTFFDHGVTVVDISAPDAADFVVLAQAHESSLGIASRGH